MAFRLARLAGTANEMELQDSMDELQFQRWLAYNKVEPLNHEAKMLGLIAYMLGSYLGVKLNGEATLENICMPWADTDVELTGSDFKGILPGLV